LRLKFLIPVLSLILLFTMAAVFWVPWQVRHLLNEELIQRGKLAAEALDKSSIGALVVEDQGALNQLAKGFIRSNEILFVLILDKEGRNLADSGIEAGNSLVVESRLPQLQKTEVDFVGSDKWPATGEPFFTIGRPVFYEQLRIGTIAVGISTRRVSLSITQLQTQMGLLCAGLLGVGAVLAIFSARSLSRPLQEIAAGMSNQSSQELESAAGSVKELNLLVESIEKTQNLFQTSVAELEQQKIELEAALAKSQEENSSAASRLSVVTKQVESLQAKVQSLQATSKHLTKVLPLVQFATGIAPEMDASMQHISGSAEKLRLDLERLQNLVSLYEKASPLVPEDMEVIRQYRDFINYDQIKQSMDELVTTIRGGADWAEQLADLLKQFSVDDLDKTGSA
jgi:sensor histidine kinase regulating citrate/malate metabolism